MHLTDVRTAVSDDAGACVAIYRPYVQNTVISFETEVPTVAEMASRIAATHENHEWLVVESQREVIGYAYAHGLNPRPAYQWSVETTVYVSDDHRRTGAGRALYSELLRRLAQRGYRQAFAAIAQPNDASNAFHRSFGYRPAGLLHGVGWKKGAWHDVAWMQLDLRGSGDVAEPPKRITPPAVS